MINVLGRSFAGGIQIVLLEPFKGVPSIVVVDHSADFDGIVPKVAKSPRMIIGLFVVFVCFVPQISCENCEDFANVLRVRMDEHE